MDELFKLLGLENLSEAEKKEFTEKIEALLDDRILLRITSELTDEQAKEAEKMETEEFMNNLDKFGIDLEKIGREEGQKLREELVGNMAYMQGYLEAQKNENQEKPEKIKEKAVKHSDF